MAHRMPRTVKWSSAQRPRCAYATATSEVAESPRFAQGSHRLKDSQESKGRASGTREFLGGHSNRGDLFVVQVERVSKEQFDAAFDQDACIAELTSPEEETAYERQDSFLIHLIKRACREVLGVLADRHVHHLEDWWPNHTRYVYVSRAYATWQLIEKLRSLLTDDFGAWRIQVVVSENLTADVGEDIEVGSLVIYCDRIVMESAVASQCFL